MQKRKPGKRHPLLLYRRTMDRLWRYTFPLGLILAVAWAYTFWSGEPVFANPTAEVWLFVGACLTLAFSLFALLTRSMAYVRAYPAHLAVVTPFLRLNIAYRRVNAVRSASLQQIFPPARAGWAERSYLTPFYAKTGVVVDLNRFPLAPGLLRLFLPAQMFARQSTGLVLLVADWMSLSTELDSMLGVWRQSQGSDLARPGLSGRL